MPRLSDLKRHPKRQIGFLSDDIPRDCDGEDQCFVLWSDLSWRQKMLYRQSQWTTFFSLLYLHYYHKLAFLLCFRWHPHWIAQLIFGGMYG